MTQTHYHIALITAVIMFVVVLVFNTLANTLPINNQTTGQVSFQYPNLFQPSGMTFSIWGLIYFSLGAWMIYQLFQWQMPINASSKISSMFFPHFQFHHCLMCFGFYLGTITRFFYQRLLCYSCLLHSLLPLYIQKMRCG